VSAICAAAFLLGVSATLNAVKREV
jgi:hypothetical protein